MGKRTVWVEKQVLRLAVLAQDDKYFYQQTQPRLRFLFLKGIYEREVSRYTFGGRLHWAWRY